MLTVKLVRIGKKNAPRFRVRVGPEFIGTFNPQLTPPKFIVDKSRLDYWLKQGAKMSSAVAQLVKGKYEFKRYIPRKAEVTEVAKETKATEVAGVAGTVSESKPETTA